MLRTPGAAPERGEGCEVEPDFAEETSIDPQAISVFCCFSLEQVLLRIGEGFSPSLFDVAEL